MSDQTSIPSGPSWQGIAKLASLLMGLAALSFCLCGAVFAVFPLLSNQSSSDTTLTAGEGLMTGSICLVPAIVLLIAALGTWFLFGRKQ